MAAQKENLLSLGHLTGTEKNTFTKQREHYFKTSVDRPMELQADYSTLQRHQRLRVMHLQQRWLELKEREHTARQHNRQLLEQFEQAQETLKEMLACNAAMKTIRMEYERYLEESAPRWQQQLKEQTQAAQRKQRMENYLRSYLNNAEDGRVTKSSVNHPLPTQGPATRSQKATAPQVYADYNQSHSSHLPYPQSSWLAQPQSQSLAGRFPIRAPHQLHSSSPVPPSFHPTPIFPHPHPFPFHNLTSSPGAHHNHHWCRQDPPGWAPMQTDYSWPYAAEIPSRSKTLWGQLYVDEPSPDSRASQTVVEEDNVSSKRERCHLSQELDIKPVRLTGGHTDSSESGRDSSQASREKRVKREKRGRQQHAASSEGESCTSEETSSAIVIPSGRVTKSPDSDTSLEGGHTSRRKTSSEGFTVLSPKSEKVAKEKSTSIESQRPVPEEQVSASEESISKELESDSKSEICGEESGSQREDESGRESTKNEHGVADEIEARDSSSTEEEEEERQKHLGAGEDDEKENSQKDTEQEDRDVEHDDDEREITTEEEEEAAAEETQDQGDDEEQSDKMHNKEPREQDSSSEDEEVNEDVSKGSEEKTEEDEEQESEEEEAGGSDEEEDRDSDDSIISPQEKRSKQMQTIPEEAAEDDDEEENKDEGDSEDEEDSSDEFSEDNIENLLAPQEQTTKKEEKDLKASEKPKALCDKMQIFQVEQDGLKTDQPSDSDEFDHFYD